jgi:hypothetical protein
MITVHSVQIVWVTEVSEEPCLILRTDAYQVDRMDPNTEARSKYFLRNYGHFLQFLHGAFHTQKTALDMDNFSKLWSYLDQ